MHVIPLTSIHTACSHVHRVKSLTYHYIISVTIPVEHTGNYLTQNSHIIFHTSDPTGLSRLREIIMNIKVMLTIYLLVHVINSTQDICHITKCFVGIKGLPGDIGILREYHVHMELTH